MGQSDEPRPLRPRLSRSSLCRGRFLKRPVARARHGCALLVNRAKSDQPESSSSTLTLHLAGQRSNRFSRSSSSARACAPIEVNSRPISLPGTTLRTTASACTTPPGTSKTNIRLVPTGLVMDAERDKPPLFSVFTRDTCWNPPPYQATDMPFGREIRLCRRVLEGASLAIDQEQSTTSLRLYQ